MSKPRIDHLIAGRQQDDPKLCEALLILQNVKGIAVGNLAPAATLTDVINKINELLSSLRGSEIISR